MTNQPNSVPQLRAPFPYFGSKRKIASKVWDLIGHDVKVYVEPFAGSAAVLLQRPSIPEGVFFETINDVDSMVANFWRSISKDPEAVAAYSSWPVVESELHSRHMWMLTQKDSLTERILGSVDYYDPVIAGYWVWGISLWIGGGFCSGKGPWAQENGRLVNLRDTEKKSGSGATIQKPKLSHAGGQFAGASRKTPETNSRGPIAGRGLIPDYVSDILSDGVDILYPTIKEWLCLLGTRLSRVRVISGDWKRVVTPSVTYHCGKPVGILLDPPYKLSLRDSGLYASDAQKERCISSEVNKFCIDNGNNKDLRIVVCGLNGEHNNLEDLGWKKIVYRVNGGYANQRKSAEKNNNKKIETIWYSSSCLDSPSSLSDLM